MTHHPALPPGVPHDSPLGQKILGGDKPAKREKGRQPPSKKALVDRIRDGEA
ncbi:hypothetical protein [Phenylobacterium sp.]|uniref:hypothetical protein n=1 Tax=Phenylobacterium sp. TaxID=1871053 RepID=UPI002DF1ECB6|nr:hypothetical protein [Phenylobacterium sp.]